MDGPDCMKGADMQEVFEKIVDKLEACKDVMLSPNNSDCFGEECKYSDCMVCAFANAIEIVKQEAEQYNNGWNYIKDGVPPVGEPLIVTIKDNMQGRPNELRYPAYYEKDSMRGGYHWSWRYGDITYELLPDVSEVIAWQPLPEPYKEGE